MKAISKYTGILLGLVLFASCDLEKLDYITSAGLRVVLAAQKAMSKQGSMKVRNVKPEIMNVTSPVMVP